MRSAASRACSVSGLTSSRVISAPGLLRPVDHGERFLDDRRRGGRAADAQLLAELALEAFAHVGVLLEVLACVLAALTEALVAVAEPGAEPGHVALVDPQVEQLAFARDPLVVE